MPTISIIIPIYNVSEFIVPCLESVLSQSFSDFELLLVDDKGADDSLIKALSFLEQRNVTSFTVIHNEVNQGLSRSRNNAMKVAKGEYLYFLDSDDQLAEGALLELVEAAEQYGADVVTSGLLFRYLDRDVKPLNVDKETLFRSSEAIVELLSTYRISTTACGKLIKRSLFTQNNIVFPEGVYFEDIPTVLRLLKASDTVVSLPSYGYIYLQSRESSIMSSIKVKSVLDTLEVETIFSEIAPTLSSQENAYLNIYRFNFLYRGALWLKQLEVGNSQKVALKKELGKRMLHLLRYNFNGLKLSLKSVAKWLHVKMS